MLWVGLGNPGKAYERTRHNVGFMALDALVRDWSFSPFRRRFSGDLAEGNVSGKRVFALKPQTFMNLSGQSVGEALRFLGLSPSRMLVFHDDLDLPFGKVKTKFSGGHAGHNGLRSLHAHVGPEFHRVRIGIGHPGDRALVSDYVLSPFSAGERSSLEGVIEEIVRRGEAFASGEWEAWSIG